jgi:hypothetical protein
MVLLRGQLIRPNTLPHSAQNLVHAVNITMFGSGGCIWRSVVGLKNGCLADGDIGGYPLLSPPYSLTRTPDW